MPTLKELLDAYGKASARNAFPSSSGAIAISFVDGSYNNSYTAPTDGYLVGGLYDGGVIQLRATILQGAYTGTAVNFAYCFVPLRKGETVIWYAKGNEPNAEHDFFKFVPCKA